MLTLREMGVTAEWVDSGQKAIEQVRELHEAGKYYDMILIDWKMPDMDGIETARRIRADAGPEVTIIIMTAYDWSNIEHEGQDGRSQPADEQANVQILPDFRLFQSAWRKGGDRAEDNSALFDFTGRRVLLVEDNAINTEVAMVLLESKGFAVDTAENGLRAIEMFSKSEAGSYDAVLMDIRMPQMDGLTAANKHPAYDQC